MRTIVDQTAQAYERLLVNFVHWAQAEEDVRVAAVIGSRARGDDHPADEFSDLDIAIVVADPQAYREATGWIEAIGTPWLAFVESPDPQTMERRVLFEGGLDVDFAFMPLDPIRQMLKTGISPDMGDVYRRGMRVLVDKDGLAAQLQDAAAGPPQPLPPPSQAEYLQVANDFWYHTVWTAKHLRRGELWWAKGCCDSHLKWLLLRMMEWHARATKGPDYDTWMRGRFLEEWVDPRARVELCQAFARYDEDEIWRALAATMDLFRWLSVETAERWGYPYPTFGAERATELVRKLFDGKNEA